MTTVRKRAVGKTTQPVDGDALRVKQQLDAYKAAQQQVQQHIQRHTVDEMQFYPAHDQRRETPEYKTVHEKMTKQMDLPCLICGVRNSTLGDPSKNPYGAKQMETHHHIIEWALANAIDENKFNSILRPHLAHRHPNDPVWQYETPFTVQKIRDWVDHSEHNLWVLCDANHRGKYVGIHEVTYPIWSPMNLLRDDFEEWARREIDKLEKK
jgi:hypothetical protein